MSEFITASQSSNLLIYNPRDHLISFVSHYEKDPDPVLKSGEGVLKFYILVTRKSKWVDKPNSFFGKRHQQPENNFRPLVSMLFSLLEVCTRPNWTSLC